MPSVLSAAHFHNEEAAYAFVEAWLWPNGRVCPHCGVIDASGPLKGKSTRIGVYKCYACRKPFTVKVGTIFESSHIKLHVWLQAIHLMASSKKGFTTNQFARILGVTVQTAWFLSHRLREAMIDIAPQGPLGGKGKFVEADEAFIGGGARNRAYYLSNDSSGNRIRVRDRNDDAPVPRRYPGRCQPGAKPLSDAPDFSTVIITVPCPQCRQQTLKSLRELIVSDSVTCRGCGTPIDITRPYWREALRKAAESARKVEPKPDRQ